VSAVDARKKKGEEEKGEEMKPKTYAGVWKGKVCCSCGKDLSIYIEYVFEARCKCIQIPGLFMKIEPSGVNNMEGLRESQK